MNQIPYTESNALHLPGPDWQELIELLSVPFAPEDVQWRAGSTSKDKTKALALAYASSRIYEDRLNTICPGNWHVTFEPWGENRIICKLTIHGVSRSSTGEDTSGTDNAGTTAEAQAFKRACSKFGLGRFLYDLPATWAPYDATTKRLKETPRLPGGSSSNSQTAQAPAHLEAEGIGRKRAAAMHRELARAGLPSNQHYALASAVIGRTITSLARLTEIEAAKVWRTARPSASVN